MRFEGTTIKIKGGAKFQNQVEEIPVEVPQIESLADAQTFFGNEDGIVGACNAFLSSRAPGNFRTKVAAKTKTATSWDDVVKFAKEQASSVKEYVYSGERGLSAKKVVENVRSLTLDSLKSMSPEQLAELLGISK